MPQGRVADLVLGSDAYLALVPNAAFNDATYHVGLIPTVGAQFPTGQANALGLKAGAAVATDLLYSPGKYLQLTIDITAITATGTVTVTILGFDPISGKFYTILASTALGAVATTVLRVGPALTAAANLVANDFMPFTWACQVVVATAQPMTFSIGANFMP
jgi:hypothetical protein